MAESHKKKRPVEQYGAGELRGVSMERLTKRDIDGCLIHTWSFNGINGSYDIRDEELLTKQIDRLAAYEDLMERWKLRSIEEADRIFQRVNVLGGTDLMAQYRALGSVDHLRELAKAEQDGRLVVLADSIYFCGGKDQSARASEGNSDEGSLPEGKSAEFEEMTTMTASCHFERELWSD